VTAVVAQPARRTGSLGRGAWLLVTLCLVTVGGAILFARGWRPLGAESTARVTAEVPGMSIPAHPSVEERYGVRFTAAVLTARQGMIELRFQVLDQDKAAAIHGEDHSPVLEADGFRFDAPGMAGHGTHAKVTPAAGSSGFTLLANIGGRLASGSTVTIVVGDLTIEQVVLG
jgi:hypothetical protein